MTKTMFALIAGAALLVNAAAAVEYKTAGEWLKLPEGRPTLGSQHGVVAFEECGQTAKSGSLPLTDLVGMQAVLGSDLGDGTVFLQDLLHHLGLESGGMRLA